jgi:ATP-binding cassette subfamily F protein uup
VSVLTAQALHKAFGPQVVLDAVDVTIQPGERVGFVGLNGSGKSTLARILAGIEVPDAGSVAVRRDAEIAYLAQEPVFPDGATARQAVASGLKAWSRAKARYDGIAAAMAATSSDDDTLLESQLEAEAEIERLGGWDLMHTVEAMLGHVGIREHDARLDAMSGGERRRVALAQVLVARAALTILDEPTNHLDASTVEWLEGYLIDEHAGALLLITHDRYLLDRVVQRTLEVDRGKVFSYPGGYESYLEAKAERQAHAARAESNRQNFLRRELEWLRRQPKARSTKQKARIERAETARAVQAPKAERTASLALAEARSGKTILELHKLGLERGGRVLVRELNLFLPQGERMGIIGPNGAGKTSLLKAIAGELEPTAGKVVLGKNTRIILFDQERAGLDDAASVFDNVAGGQGVIELGGQVIEPRAWLERFLFDTSKQRQPVGSLSGGERARVALAKMLRQPASLVILDEPTNDLDVATLGALEELLVEFGGSALVVTHDRWFLDRVATSILSFEDGGKVVLYPGNYTTFRRLREENLARERQQARAASESKAPRASRPPGKLRAGLTYGERLELESIVAKIDAAEAHVQELEVKLAQPGTYAGRGEEVRQLIGELEQARAHATELTARWEELEAKKG